MRTITVYIDLSSVWREIEDEHFLEELVERKDSLKRSLKRMDDVEILEDLQTLFSELKVGIEEELEERDQ